MMLMGSSSGMGMPALTDGKERARALEEEFKAFIDAENEDEEMPDEENGGGVIDSSLKRQESSSRKAKKVDLVFEIHPDHVEQVKEACIKRNLPLIEEYDFKRDTDKKRSPDLEIELKSST